MARAARMGKQTILRRLLQTQFPGRFQDLVESTINEAPHLLERCKINRKNSKDSRGKAPGSRKKFER
jgi:hypothetical protein